eukprot:5221694-Lingulodinium_polyedra.AAC.1
MEVTGNTMNPFTVGVFRVDLQNFTVTNTVTAMHTSISPQFIPLLHGVKMVDNFVESKASLSTDATQINIAMMFKTSARAATPGGQDTTPPPRQQAPLLEDVA